MPVGVDHNWSSTNNSLKLQSISTKAINSTNSLGRPCIECFGSSNGTLETEINPIVNIPDLTFYILCERNVDSGLLQVSMEYYEPDNDETPVNQFRLEMTLEAKTGIQQFVSQKVKDPNIKTLSLYYDGSNAGSNDTWNNGFPSTVPVLITVSSRRTSSPHMDLYFDGVLITSTQSQYFDNGQYRPPQEDELSSFDIVQDIAYNYLSIKGEVKIMYMGIFSGFHNSTVVQQNMAQINSRHLP